MTRTQRTVLVLLVLLLSSCRGDEPQPVSRRSLLGRTPDGILSQPGVLAPAPRTQWGPHGGPGWRAETNHFDEESFVWTRFLVASLVLPAGPPRDRDLRVRMWCPPPAPGGDPGQRIALRLNGVEMGTVVAGTTPREHSLRTPGAAWREGDNVLEIEAEELRVPEGSRAGSTGPGAGVAVSRIAYDDPRSPVVDSRREHLALIGDTGVVYDLEQITPTDLHLTGEASAPGRLALVFSRVDPASGEVLSVEESLEMSVEGGELDRHLPLPDAQKAILRLELAWRSDTDSVLTFERLEVTERSEVARIPIVFLAIDTLSAEHMSVYGYERETTPSLQRFARDAVVFEHCVTNAPWTLPSFMSVMTGLYAQSHMLEPERPVGVEAQVWELWSLAENRWTLAEALRAAGWSTAGFVDNLWLTDRFQFPQGFDVYDASAGDLDKLDPDGGIRHVSKLALDWLDEAKRDPYFLFLHCFDVHGPYGADGAHDGMFEGDALWDTEEVRFAGGTTNAFGTIPTYITARDHVDRPTPDRLPTGPIVAAYDEGVAMTDEVVGRFLDDLKERGLYDDALIVVSADHGETMGDRDYLFGHGVLDEICLRVPLMIKLPSSAGGGRRVDQTVQLVDLYSTILDLAGLAHDRPHVHGRSLVPLLRGEELPPAPTLTESGIMTQSALYFDDWKLVIQLPGVRTPDKVMLTHPRLPREWREENTPELLDRPFTDELLAQVRLRPDYSALIRQLSEVGSRPIIELYRPRDDPGERVNLRDENPEKVRELTGMLARLLSERAAAEQLAKPPATPAQLSAEDAEELRKLGYLDG